MAREASEWANGRLKRARQRQGAFDFLVDEGDPDAPFDMSAVDADGLKDAIVAWVGRGYAITFGRTSDGGAVGVHLLAGGEKKSRYFAEVSQLEDFLATVREAGRAREG